MSIMQTSVSGMKAQANRLSAVSGNIANVSTVGYKKESTEFSTLVLGSGKDTPNGGGVETTVRRFITQAGGTTGTQSSTDLAINGKGFFVVEDARGNTFLTRAGAFVPDSEGNLVNSAGFYLMGYSMANGDPGVTLNSLQGMERINVSSVSMQAVPSTEGVFSANVDARATAVVPAAGPPPVALPSANIVGSTYTSKSSLVVYDNLGGEVKLDVYLTKTADDNWEVAVFDQAGAAAGGFPYAAPPGMLGTANIVFDPTNGKLTAASPSSLTLNVPGGQPLIMDLAGMTQLKAEFTPMVAEANGNAPGTVSGVSIGDNGVVAFTMQGGSLKTAYRIALADVPSPDFLTPLSGNVYSANVDSGAVFVGFPGTGSFGSIAGSTLEQSNVDLAEELATMIDAQRNYTANSKVFQTGADILDVLVNLKR